MDGYKGIWFQLGQLSEYGDKVSGATATYPQQHRPLAIYAPEVDKTFFVYGGTTGPYDNYLLCMAGVFDHKSGRVARPTIVYDKLSVYDPHDNPAICIDGKGYIWVFVSGRANVRPGFKYRSKEPYSIDAFDQITEEEMAYPQPKYIPGKGFFNLFTKYTGIRELYFETSPDGVKWTADRKLAGMKRAEDKYSGHYQFSAHTGEKIGTFFSWHPNGNVDLRTNVYYVQTTDFGKTWTTVDGKKLTIPLEDINSPARAIDHFSQDQNVYFKDVAFDADGHPVALYLAGKDHRPGPTNGPRKWYVLHWNGTSWENNFFTTTDHNYDIGCLIIEGNEWTVVAPTENTPQQWGSGGEVVIWKSDDKGKTWRREKQITARSQRNHNYIRSVVNGKDPFKYFWSDGNPDEMSESLLYFGDSKGTVWKLPYNMAGDEQLPVVVRALTTFGR